MPKKDAEIKRIVAAKRKLKRDLIRLSFYEKIQRIIHMQKIAAKLSDEKNRRPIWNP